MIRARQVPLFLEQVNGDGVVATILMTKHGDILGSVGDFQNFPESTLAAISANVFVDFDRAGKDLLGSNNLDFFLIDYEEWVVAIKNTANQNDNDNIKVSTDSNDVKEDWNDENESEDEDGEYENENEALYHGLLLCVIAAKETPIGLLKNKLTALSAHISESLKPIIK